MFDDLIEKRFVTLENRFTSLEKVVDDVRSQGEATHQLLRDLLNRLSLDPTSLAPSVTTTTHPSPRPPTPPLHIAPPLEQRKARIKPAPPADFDGDRSKGKAFLTSCRTYIRLTPDMFDNDAQKMIWAMSYMKSGRAGRWAAREFEHEATSGSIRFYDWDEFEEEFRKAFVPLNVEAAAVNTLETTSYFQGKRSVDEYLDQFRDLIHDSGYKDPKTIVVKFRRGLDRRISNALAGMTTGRPSDTDPEAWFHLATQMDQNSATDRAFHASWNSPPSIAPLSRPTPPMPPRPAPPVSFAHISPSPGNPVPMEIDAARRAKAIGDTCRRCGKVGHWANDCPHRFDIRCSTAEELRAALNDLGAESEDDLAPPEEVEDLEEAPPSHEPPSHLKICTLEGGSHHASAPSRLAPPETQTSSRRLSKEGVSVRGSSPLPSSRLRSSPRPPAVRPADPPYVPPNIRPSSSSYRW